MPAVARSQRQTDRHAVGGAMAGGSPNTPHNDKSREALAMTHTPAPTHRLKAPIPATRKTNADHWTPFEPYRPTCFQLRFVSAKRTRLFMTSLREQSRAAAISPMVSAISGLMETSRRASLER